MAKAKRRNRRVAASGISRRSGESRGAEVLTVGWLLSVITTLVCELGAMAANWYAGRDAEVTPIAVLASLLLFASLVTGMLVLLLTVVVWRLRHEKPPPGIVVFAVVVGLLPVIALVWRGLLQ